MKKIIYVFILLTVFSIVTFGDVLNELDNPSAYGISMGGALYTVFAGPQSIAYNPAGIATEGGFFFSHIEHYLGIIRNDFLAGSLNAGNFYFSSSMQTTRSVDVSDLNYSQYIFSGAIAYRIKNISIGTGVNGFFGTDVINGFSMDLGGIFQTGNYTFAAVLKNALASITWQSTPPTVENYPAEMILGVGYSTSSFDVNTFVNFTSKEFGAGVQFPLTRFFSIVGGYKGSIDAQISNALSAGLVVKNYLGFDLFVSYTFLDSANFGQLLSPFTVSMNYNFGG